MDESDYYLSFSETKEQDAGTAAPPPPERREEFVNTGYLNWERGRAEWLEQRHGSGNNSNININNHHHRHGSAAAAVFVAAEEQRRCAIPLEVDEIIDLIFTSPRQIRDQGGPRKFAKSVPLPQMVDILQDLWEAEGLA